MATSRLLTKGTAAATLVNKLFAPLRSVSAAPSIRRSFSTCSDQVSVDEDSNGSSDEDQHCGSYVSCRCDRDLFSGVFIPISPPQSLSQIFNMMEQFKHTSHTAASHAGAPGANMGWAAKETTESLSFRFDMPGLDKGNVKVYVEENTLIIKAESKNEAEEEVEDEPPCCYSTRIDLPEDHVFKPNEIEAEMKNGVLKVMVPKVKMEEREDVWEVEVK